MNPDTTVFTNALIPKLGPAALVVRNGKFEFDRPERARHQ